MIVYLDVLFAVNAIVNVLLLHAACLFAGKQATLIRLIPAGSLGGLYAVLAALPQLTWLGFWPGKLACAVGMLLIAFGASRQTLRLGLWFGILSAAFAGIVLVLTGLFGVRVYMLGGTAIYPISVPALVLTAGISYCTVSVLLKNFGKQSAASDLRPVTICLAGKKHRFTALVDTGNLLHDPMTGKPVFVLDAACAGALLPSVQSGALEHPTESFAQLARSIPGLRLVPYRAVGVPAGMMLAVKSDWIILGKKKLPGATVAFSPSPVSGGAYQVIAGGS